MHVHSAYSHDGKLTLAECAGLCRKNGYKFLVVTEHAEDIDRKAMHKIVSECELLSNEELVLIPGLEFISEDGMHIIGVGIRKKFYSRKTEKIIHGIHRLGGIAILAHVSYYKKIPIPYAKLSDINGIEIWNQRYDGWFAPRLKYLKIRSKLKDDKSKGFYAGNDIHKAGDFGKLSICIQNINLGEKEVLNALKKRDFIVKNGLIVFNPEKIRIYQSIIFMLMLAIYDSFKFIKVRIVKTFFKSMGIKPPGALKRVDFI